MRSFLKRDFHPYCQIADVNTKEKITVSRSGRYLAYTVGVIIERNLKLWDNSLQKVVFEKKGKFKVYFSDEEDKFCIHDLLDSSKWNIVFYSFRSDGIPVVLTEISNLIPNMNSDVDLDIKIDYKPPISLIAQNQLLLVSRLQNNSTLENPRIHVYLIDWTSLTCQNGGHFPYSIGGRAGEGCDPIIINFQGLILSILGEEGYLIRFFQIIPHFRFFSEITLPLHHLEVDTELIFTTWNFQGKKLAVADSKMVYFLDGTTMRLEKELDLHDSDSIRNMLWLPDGNALLLKLEQNKPNKKQSDLWMLLDFATLSLKKTRNFPYSNASYSPDGQYLICCDSKKKTCEIFKRKNSGTIN